MRLSDFLVAVNLTALAHGSCGSCAADGWGSKAAASNSRPRRSERRVFSNHGQHMHSSSTVAFLGHRPSTATTRAAGGSELEAAVAALPKPVAAETGDVAGSTDTASDEITQEPSEPR